MWAYQTLTKSLSQRVMNIVPFKLHVRCMHTSQLQYFVIFWSFKIWSLLCNFLKNRCPTPTDWPNQPNCNCCSKDTIACILGLEETFVTKQEFCHNLTREGTRQLDKISFDKTLKSTLGVIRVLWLVVCRLVVCAQYVTSVIFTFF